MHITIYTVSCSAVWGTQLLTVQTLLEELKEVDDWYLFGAYLGVPVYKLNEIQSEHRGIVERCKLNMLQYWLNTTMTASWRDIARAVEQMDRLTLAAKLKRKYLWGSPTPEGMCYIILAAWRSCAICHCRVSHSPLYC